MNYRSTEQSPYRPGLRDTSSSSDRFLGFVSFVELPHVVVSILRKERLANLRYALEHRFGQLDRCKLPGRQPLSSIVNGGPSPCLWRRTLQTPPTKGCFYRVTWDNP